jgi:hypothetical protein
MSVFPGATSSTKPKSRFGGLERSQAGLASSEGCRPRLFDTDGSQR